MKVEYMAPGLAIAAIGFSILFGLLASVSALAKSKQLGAMGALASGAAGGSKRVLFFIAIGSMVLGACGTFAGVAKSDGERAKACNQMCLDKGYAAGKIGPSSNPAPKPAAACVCSGGQSAGTPFEMKADDLTF